jgi:hypothetical protein
VLAVIRFEQAEKLSRGQPITLRACDTLPDVRAGFNEPGSFLMIFS